MKYYLETFGCQMNSSDSEIIRGRLESAGFEKIEDPGEADVLLVNTCSIREHAEIRAIGRLSDLYRFRKSGKGKVLGVLGCIPQHYGGRLLKMAPWVDLAMGPDNYRDLPGAIRSIIRGEVGLHRTMELDRRENYDGIKPVRENGASAWIQVMRGCDRFCSYCVVPYVRGRERSRDPREILEDASSVTRGGTPEIVLIGQNVNAYSFEGVDFPELLRRVSGVRGLRRLRFITSHPLDFSEELISVVRDTPAICKAIHLPLQSGSNRVLKAMNRGYTVEDYTAKVDTLRREIPSVSISTDLMVGFPGETEDDFLSTIEAVENIGFDNAYTYKYSRRKWTKASRYPDQVDPAVGSERLSRLIEVQREITVKINRALVGSELEVLVEGRAKKGKDMLLARTEGDKMVVFRGNGQPAGSLHRVRIVDIKGTTLVGKLKEESPEKHR